MEEMDKLTEQMELLLQQGEDALKDGDGKKAAECYYRRSDICRRTNQEALARADLEKVLQIDPAHKEAKTSLAYLKLKGKILIYKDNDYLVINTKKIDNLELCITTAMAPPNELKILDVRIEDDGQLMSRTYVGEYAEKITKEFTPQKIQEYLQDIRKIAI